MKDGHCPGCKSREVYVNETHHASLGFQQNSSQKERDPLGNVQGGVAVYMCNSCGFTAFFAKDVAGVFGNLPSGTGWKKVS